MTIPAPSPWPSVRALDTVDRFDFSPVAVVVRAAEIDLAVRRGEIRGDWKFQARRAVADGIAAGLIHTTPTNNT